MVLVLPHKEFGQEKSEKPPTRYVSPDVGSDPIASEPTDAGPATDPYTMDP